MPFRPNVILKPKVVNDVLSLLNEQKELASVPNGTVLKIQNKSAAVIFIHETDSNQVAADDGVAVPIYWRYETNATAAGIKATVKGSTVAVIGVEVVESE